MSHTPVRADGTVYKRKLNCIRPAAGGGPAPPSGLTFYYGETEVPGGVVTGPAETERDVFVSYLTTVEPETFEEFENLDFIDTAPLLSNGNAFHFAVGTNAETRINQLGRFNTTPGGALFAQVSNGFTVDIVFDDLVAGFGCFFTDMGDFDAEWTATIYDEFNVPTVVPIGNSVGVINGSLIFWGWLDNSGLLYSRVTFTAPVIGQVDAIGIDDVITPSTAQINY